MRKQKIYLDICTYNRLFDIQTQIKIRLETEAKLFVQASIRGGLYSMVWSYMHDYENNATPYEEKKKSIALWKGFASEYCPSSEDILKTGQDFMKYGIKPKDALHIACALKSGCEYFITTDKGLLNKAITSIKIINPIDFVRETEDLA